MTFQSGLRFKPDLKSFRVLCKHVLRKIIATTFVFYCDAKHLDTLLGSSHGFCWEVVVKNGPGLLDHGTLKSAASQEIELMK